MELSGNPEYVMDVKEFAQTVAMLDLQQQINDTVLNDAKDSLTAYYTYEDRQRAAWRSLAELPLNAEYRTYTE